MLTEGRSIIVILPKEFNDDKLNRFLTINKSKLNEISNSLGISKKELNKEFKWYLKSLIKGIVFYIEDIMFIFPLIEDIIKDYIIYDFEDSYNPRLINISDKTRLLSVIEYISNKE